MSDAILALLQDEAVQELIINGIIALIGAFGVSASWLKKIKSAIEAVVPALVVKVVAEYIDNKSEQLVFESLNVPKAQIAKMVNGEISKFLPKGAIAVAPLVEKASKKLIDDAFSDLVRGDIPKAALTVGADISENLSTIGANVTAQVNDVISVGAGTKIDLKNGKVNFGPRVSFKF